MKTTTRHLATVTLGVVLTAGVVHSQAQFPDPSPAPNIHFPSELDDGIIARTTIGAISDHLRGSISYGAGGSAITWKLGEKDPASTSDWHTVTTVETLSLTVTAVTSREGGREVYIAGVKYNGQVVIRKWVYGVRTNGWALSSPEAPLPIGQSMPEFVPIEGLNGTSWVAPASTTGRPAVRSAFWSSSSAEVISALAVDPEGRYLLALSYPSGDLQQFDLSFSPVTPTTILSAAEESHLHKSAIMVIWQHATEGRKCIIKRKLGSWAYDDRQVVLSDVDNDGVYESHSYYDATQWKAGGYDDYHAFRRYWNTGIEFNWDE